MVENAKIVNLSNPVVLTFWHNSSTNNSKNTCVFWNMEQDGNGRWNTYGCVTTNEENKTICQCNHLTYFAVLMKISADAIDQAVLDSLTYITYIGCTITVLSCGATLIILYKSLGMKRSNSSHQGKYTVQVLTHLILAVLLLNGNFLLSGVLIYISNDIVCRIGAMCLHSSLLATLTWMGIVGFNLYKQVVKVFNTYETLYIRKLCIIGWDSVHIAETGPCESVSVSTL
ncbi:adhesion G-protein coupled receptor G1-like [Protopterus annectens]|uniref:adhesion G-protein coupled receptor G1-like n=1 Tax=Protopterus annectens TaxID=7888 RepID=UPI001CFAF902|nr:adhesion G-protein coupled receptor G1-like [Protopterus annectens]